MDKPNLRSMLSMYGSPIVSPTLNQVLAQETRRLLDEAREARIANIERAIIAYMEKDQLTMEDMRAHAIKKSYPNGLEEYWYKDELILKIEYNLGGLA